MLQVLGHNANPRGRMFSIIWVAAPAVAAIAWTVLNAARTAAKARLGGGSVIEVLQGEVAWGARLLRF